MFITMYIGNVEARQIPTDALYNAILYNNGVPMRKWNSPCPCYKYKCSNTVTKARGKQNVVVGLPAPIPIGR